MKVSAIVVAAGTSSRMELSSGEKRKPYFLINKKPILFYALAEFEANPKINDVVVVVKKEDIEYCEKQIIKKFGFKKIKNVCIGGKLRQDSVYNGLRIMKNKPNIVLVHDSARPFITSKIVDESISAACKDGASVVAIPVVDTVKYSTKGEYITSTLSRDKIWLVQTPQVFKYDLVMKAYQKAYNEGFYGTDDSSLVERIGAKVKIVMGSYQNIKITTRQDLILAELICKNLK